MSSKKSQGIVGIKVARRLLTRMALAALPLISSSAAWAHGISEADKQAMLDAGYIRYVWLGATHMLTGYDHLLFIFGVIFFLTGFKDIVRYITAFTLGHSITLVFATIFRISANYYLVDAVIALSVVYKGFDNIDGFRRFMGREPPKLISIIFCFGLIHGFGLATRLQQLPLGQDGLIARILSFNVGVEIGQIIALSFMIAVIAGWRRSKSFKDFSAVSNNGLIAAGLLLFLMQMHGFMHTVAADDFPLSDDNHRHAHQDMDAESKHGNL